MNCYFTENAFMDFLKERTKYKSSTSMNIVYEI